MANFAFHPFYNHLLNNGILDPSSDRLMNLKVFTTTDRAWLYLWLLLDLGADKS